MSSPPTFTVVVRNALVGHIWRLMPQRAVYRNWYLGQGAFVRQHPDVQGFVRSYVDTEDASAAIGSLFSATERLLRYALQVAGVTGPILNQTLPNKLEYCVSPNQSFFNIIGMCCDVRSIYLINSIRIGAEHGDHRRDQEELAHGNWNPADVDAEYQKIVDHRLISPHLLICSIFDQVDPETGHFSRNWKSRTFADCGTKGHDANGRLPDPVGPPVQS